MDNWEWLLVSFLTNGLRCREALPSVSNGSHRRHRKEILMSTYYDNVVWCMFFVCVISSIPIYWCTTCVCDLHRAPLNCTLYKYSLFEPDICRGRAVLMQKGPHSDTLGSWATCVGVCVPVRTRVSANKCLVLLTYCMHGIPNLYTHCSFFVQLLYPPCMQHFVY